MARVNRNLSNLEKGVEFLLDNRSAAAVVLGLVASGIGPNSGEITFIIKT
jgi:hypothetical protein